MFAAIGLGEEAQAYRSAGDRTLHESLSQSFSRRHFHQSRGQETSSFRRPDRSEARARHRLAATAPGGGPSRRRMTSIVIPRSPFRPTGNRTVKPRANPLVSPGGTMKKLLIATALVSLAVVQRAELCGRCADHSDHRQGHDFVLLADRAGRRAQGRQGPRRQRAGTRRAVRIRHQRPDFDSRKRGRRQAGRHRHLADPVRRARQADRRGGQEGQDHRHRFVRRFESLHLVPDHRQRAGRAHRRRRPRRRDQGQIRQGGRRCRADHLDPRRRLARRARQGLQGRAGRQISRPETGRRQGGGRPGDDRRSTS